MKSVFTDEYERFLRLLIDARKAAGITQQALAHTLNKPQSFVSKYERRERRLDVVEFLLVARAIGIDPHTIVTDLGASLPPHSSGDNPDE